MIQDDILEHLKVEDLPETFSLVAETCGIEVAKKLIKELGGIYMNIPRIQSMKPLIERYVLHLVKSNPEITNKRIALELGMNERTVFNLVKNLGHDE